MTITKYPQSTFEIENFGKKILIDPGSYCMDNYPVGHFNDILGVFLTHQHPDHMHVDAVKFWSSQNISIFGNDDVVKVLASYEILAKKVENRQKYHFENFEIEPVDLPHCKMIDTSDGPPNTGFLINNLFFHPGDGIEIEGLKVDTAGIPIAGPAIDYNRAWKFAKSLELKRVVPMHYSNPRFPADPEEFSKENKLGIEISILVDGQSLEIS